MKNLRQCLFKGLFVLIFGLGSSILVVSADNLTVVEHQTPLVGGSQCNGGTFPVIYYAGASAITLSDTFESNGSSLLWRFKPSNVSIYNPQGIVLFPSPLASAFPWRSNGKPANVSKVVVTTTPISIASSLPAGYTRNQIATQVVYSIVRFSMGFTNGNLQTITYLPYGGSSQQTFNYNPANPVNTDQSDQECRNIYVGFCGDGIVDNTDVKSATGNITTVRLAGGEECDLGAQNGQPGSTCSSSCQLVATPQGSGTIEKTLIGDGIVTKVGDAVQWKIVVTAKGGPISNFNIVDTLPTELAYDSYTEVNKPTGVTVNAPTGTNTKTITWKIDGTLNEGQKIELTVITKVVQMPADNQKVENVACLVVSKTEICDKEYIGKPFIEKTLIGDGIVSHTGDILEWNIIAKPNGGFIENFQFVENFVIVDGIPVQLEYVTSEIVHAPGGVSVSTPAISSVSTGTLVTWNVNGRVSGDEYVHIKVTTKVVIMPKPGEVIKNLACLVLDQERQLCDEATTTSNKPSLWIKKTFSDGSTVGKVVKVGDIVEYRIDFGNSGTGSAAIVSLKDFLPQNLGYVDSQMYLSTGSSHSSGTQGGVYVDMYGNMTLAPGVSGYIILRGEVLSSYQDSRYNKACIYLNDQEIVCDGVSYGLEEEKNLTIIKTVNGQSSWEVDKVGDTVVFTLEVRNTGKTLMSGFTVTDTLPEGLSFVSPGTANGFSFSQNAQTLIWSNYQFILQPGGSTVITFTASVNRRNNDVNEHRNIVCLTHQQDFPNWGSYPYSSDNCDDAYVKVKEKLYCRAPETDKTFYTTNSQGRVNVPLTCRSSDRANATITIDCGNGDRHTSSNQVSSYAYTCNYDIGSSTSKSYTISCTVGGETRDKDGYLCQKQITVENGGGPLGYCGDGSATHWEDCDCDDRSKNCTRDQGFDINTRIGNRDMYRNYRCVNCKLEGNGKLPDPMACFNVNNGSISINKGEMLPFYWNIEKVDREYYTTIGEGSENAVHTYNTYANANRSCRPDQAGKIALDAMVCNFRVYNGTHTQLDDKDVYEMDLPCFTKNTGWGNDWESNLLSSFIKWNHNNFIRGGGDTFWSFNPVNDGRDFAFRSSLFVIDNFGGTDTPNKDLIEKYGGQALFYSKNVDAYGEYKLSLNEVKYLQCTNGKRQKQDPYPRVCEVNFSVTEPYILQKTPSGTVMETSKALDKFYMKADGTKTFTEFLSSVLVQAKDYSDVNKKANEALIRFRDKYAKLAVKVNNAGSLFGGATVKKVPGKDIYFVEGNLNIEGYRYTYDESKSQKTRSNGNNLLYDRPFTIVQTLGNTTIKGNLDHNMMLISDGTITFDGSKNCNDAQVVRGIFYTINGQGFLSTGVQKNDRLENKDRCIGGNLHIKGVAIGNGLQRVVDNRRSELNQWFYGQPTVQQKRNYIMNGAALLIEYAPSVFTTATMPPGAEEFITALEVYRK